MDNLLRKVAVLIGGDISEREVSLWSGEATLNAFIATGVPCEAIDVANDDYIVKLQNGNYSCVFIALHGGIGENGTIQGFLETIGIPYTGSGVLASALAMDKFMTKEVWKAMQLPVLPSYDIHQLLAKDIDQALFPLVVKPRHAGSSVGITKATNKQELAIGLAKAGEYGDVIVEPWIDGDEITVGIVGQEALPSLKIVHKNTFYDYHAKYLSNETNYVCPSTAVLEEELALKNLALSAFHGLGCSGWGRVDLVKDANTGKFWLLEVNTIPGLTKTSLVPKAAKCCGITFNELILKIVANARTIVANCSNNKEAQTELQKA